MKLELKEIRKSFGEKEILHGVGFTVQSGQALGFLGRNGAGKTTTIRCLMDVFKPDSGTITLDGKPFRARDYRIGYLPEERGLYAKEQILHQLIYFAKLRDTDVKRARDNAAYWLERVGLQDAQKKRLEVLSKGNQQKVQIIQAFVHDPDIIILDEPFSGLDPINSQVLKDIIMEQIGQNKLVIFSSHQMNYVEEFCEDLAIIEQGDIILSGNLRQIKRERGRDKFRLRTADPVDGYLDGLGLSWQRDREGYILSLPAHLNKEQFLRQFMDKGYDLQLFSLYEPNLTQIFIETAGGSHA